MALKKPDGTVLTKTTVTNSGNSDTTTGNSRYTLKTDVFETFKFIGKRSIRTGTRLKFKAGQTVSQREIDEAFQTTEFVSIEPKTGPAAGGTRVLITGAKLKGATGVTFNGTAGTAFSVIDHNTIAVTTPAKTAGAVDVMIAHPDGNATGTGAFTFV